MCTISDSEIISSVVKDPVTCCSRFVIAGAVPACHILCISSNRNSLAFTRLDHICFFIVQKLNSRFFYFVFYIVICIRNRSIKLYNIFTSNITGILNFYLSSYSSVRKIYIYALKSLFKCCIGKAISKWIRYFIIIVPCFSCRTSYSCICISLSKYSICISCFIIFISCVNIFCFYFLCIDIYSRVCICPLVVAKVLCSR